MTGRYGFGVLLGRKHSFKSSISANGDVPDNGRYVQANRRVDEILTYEMGPQRGVHHYGAHRRLGPIE